MNSTTLPSTIHAILLSFSPCFTKPGAENFATLTVGWILCLGRHSISRVIQAGRCMAPDKHHSTLYRFFSRSPWVADNLGKVLFSLFLPLLPEEITLLIDDTLCHKSGPHLFGAGMHHDACRSTSGRGTQAKSHVAFAFGHNWVMLALWVPLPWGLSKGMAIPFLFRLYRSKKTCPASQYRKRTELAAELVQRVGQWCPANRSLHLVGDTEYACRTLVRSLPDDIRFTGPVCMNAALYDVPGSRQRMGRPRVKGMRLPSPHQLAADVSVEWRELVVTLYGREVTVWIKSQVCLWYTVAGVRLVRVVVTRDPKGRLDDRAYFCTDAERRTEAIVVQFSRRWEIEVAFRNAKQSMGLEDSQNGWWRRRSGSRRGKKRPGPQPCGKRGAVSVGHTLPLAFASYGIVVLWYLRHGQASEDVSRVRELAPWYRQKEHPSFGDMLAAVRREIWATRLLAYPPFEGGVEKVNVPFPLWLLAA